MIAALKNVVTHVAASSASQPLARWMEWARAASTRELRVLTYHRIGYPEQTTWDRALFSATPETFAQQLDLIAREYSVVSLADVLEAQLSGAALPHRAVLITFDDAYRDFSEYAWPLLSERNLPATLFVPTAFPGNKKNVFWWDRLCHAVRTSPRSDQVMGPWGEVPLASIAAREKSLRGLKDYIKSLPHQEALQRVEQLCGALKPAEHLENEVLDWPELRELCRDGVAIGLHTHNHPLLNRIEAAQLQTEIMDAWHILRTQVPDALPAFAYPAGAVSHEARRLLTATGINLAFTTEAGGNRIGVDDPLLLRRIHIGMTTTANVLRMKLALSRG